MAYSKQDLAIHGGPKAKTTKNLPMFPGGLEIGREEKKEVLQVLKNRYLFRYYGPKESPSKVKTLEELYARFIGSKHALALNSCTSALISGLVAAGVGPGDEVIIPSYTFFATCAAVVAARAIPIVAEVDASLTMDPADFEKKITARTKAVIPVHMRGMPARIDRIVEIARAKGIIVIEDVAQANGGTYKGKPLGSFGDMGCFSLQYHKIITSGEGGVLVTNSDLLYTRAQAYHDVAACWRKDRFAPPEFEGEIFFGVNFRMSELTGAVALAQFRKLDSILSRMRKNKKLIKDRLRGLPGITFRDVPDEQGDTAICLVFYISKAAQVEEFVKALRAEGVEAGGIYDKGVPDWHVYPHWKMLIDKMMSTKKGCPFNCSLSGPVPDYTPDDCPRTMELLGRSVHLDIPPQLSARDCAQTAEAIRKVASVLLAGTT
jgi:8-amino-3,8-dideoxy-alpha-D-manno-octulosonate transaminase